MLHSRRSFSRFSARAAALLLAGRLLTTWSQAAPPAWWAARQVIDAGKPRNDYAPVNQGQLKKVVSAAVAEMDATLEGGAGEALHALVQGWSAPGAGTNDYAPINLGQLKSLARPVYDRLIALDLVPSYPWTGAARPPRDFAPANLGQVKALFAFELAAGSGRNGVPVWWELHYFGRSGYPPPSDPAGTGMTLLEKYRAGLDPTKASTLDDGLPDWWKLQQGFSPLDRAVASADPDGDGLTNLEEYKHHSDPYNPYTAGDGLGDGWKVAHGLNPAIADTDGDGITDADELSLGLDPLVSALHDETVVKLILYTPLE